MVWRYGLEVRTFVTMFQPLLHSNYYQTRVFRQEVLCGVWGVEEAKEASHDSQQKLNMQRATE